MRCGDTSRRTRYIHAQSPSKAGTLAITVTPTFSTFCSISASSSVRLDDVMWTNADDIMERASCTARRFSDSS